MKQAYSVIAKFYDAAMTDFDYAKYYEFTKRYLTGKAVELACGSGAFTQFLVKNCDSVLAVDNSAEMLDIAVQNNLKNRNYINFIQADMQEFTPPTRVNTVVVVCDGFNYIAGDKLKAVFANIARYLKKGGNFIFDISSEYKLKEVIGNNLFFEDNDDYTYLWTNKTDDEKVQMELAVFERAGEVYKRFDEQHTQYIHNTQKVKEMLEECGFCVELFDGETFSAVQEKSRRILFVCQNN